MKKFILNLLIFTSMAILPAFAYQDSDVIAHNYNQQGLLALKHAKESKGLQKKIYLKEAKWFYQHSVDAYPDNFDGFLGLARTYMYMGRFDKAYNNMMIAFNFDKNNPEINYYMGEYSFLNEKYNTALSYYLCALNLGYQKHYNTNYQIAICYDKLGDGKQAIKFYKKCLQIDSDKKTPQNKIQEIENKDSKYKDYYNYY